MFKNIIKTVKSGVNVSGSSSNNINKNKVCTPSRSSPKQPTRAPSIFVGENFKDPMSILRNPHYNKSSAFTAEERQHHRLNGLLPAAVEDLEKQIARAYQHFCSFDDSLAKYVYLSSLRERNETLFYQLTQRYLTEIMPCIYTPTVGLACQKFGQLFRQSEGLYVDLNDNVPSVLSNWRPGHFQSKETTPNIIVVTDGSRILGLGDLGINGMGIPIGKLALYVAVGGFHPLGILPITLDVGTNNRQLLEDPLYMGIRQERPDRETYFNFLDNFMKSVQSKWPDCVVQFEDFENQYCFDILAKYRNSYRCFNDDIQGTGVVAAAGFLTAVRLVLREVGTKWDEHRIVFHGFGSASAGVANQITTCLVNQYGASAEEIRKMFYMIDSQGLCTFKRDKVTDYKHPFTRGADEDVPHNGSLEDVIRHVKPTALIGLSGDAGAFSQTILELMAENNKRPIVFALSNPTSKAECVFSDAMKHTKGTVVWAAGSPMPDCEGRASPQGNNLYAFPGIGFGAWLCQSSVLTDNMMSAATVAIANAVSDEMLDNNELYPKLTDVNEVSDKVACEIMRVAKEEGSARAPVPDSFEQKMKLVKASRYTPVYETWNCHRIGNKSSGVQETPRITVNVKNSTIPESKTVCDSPTSDATAPSTPVKETDTETQET